MITINRKCSAAIGRFGLAIAATLLVLLASFGSALAQDQTQSGPSTDRDNPTQVVSNEIKGDGVDNKTDYFYSFTAGPGEVKLTLDVKAEKSTAVSSVDLVLFEANSRKLLSTYANPDHGSTKSAVETVKVRGEQTILLEVTVSQGVDNFKIKLDGAVKIASSTSGATDTSTPGGLAPPVARSSQGQPVDEGGAASGKGAGATNNSTGEGATDAATTGANANATGAASGTSSQTSASAGSNGGKVGKAKAKINSASSTLTSIISAGSSTVDSVKSVKKKKPQ